MTKFVRTFFTKCSPYTTFSYFAAPPVFSRQNWTGSMAASKLDCAIGFREMSKRNNLTWGSKRERFLIPRRRMRRICGNEASCWQLYEAWIHKFHSTKPGQRTITYKPLIVKWTCKEEKKENLQHVSNVTNKGSWNRCCIYPLTRAVLHLKSHHERIFRDYEDGVNY